MNPILERLEPLVGMLRVLNEHAGDNDWIFIDGVNPTPLSVADTARRLGLLVEQHSPLLLVLRDGQLTSCLSFEPNDEELAATAIAMELVRDGLVPLPAGYDGTVDAELFTWILWTGWKVPDEFSRVASVATRLLMDRVGARPGQWELEVALGSQPRVLDIAQRLER